MKLESYLSHFSNRKIRVYYTSEQYLLFNQSNNTFKYLGIAPENEPLKDITIPEGDLTLEKMVEFVKGLGNKIVRLAITM